MAFVIAPESILLPTTSSLVYLLIVLLILMERKYKSAFLKDPELMVVGDDDYIFC